MFLNVLEINNKKIKELSNILNLKGLNLNSIKNEPITELEKKIMIMVKDYEKGTQKENYQLENYKINNTKT